MKPRHAEIMDLLRAENAVAVHALALRMNVSESTIRRDLAKLEEQGVLRRIHGGALLEEDVQMEPPFELRAISHRAEKDLVGRVSPFADMAPRWERRVTPFADMAPPWKRRVTPAADMAHYSHALADRQAISGAIRAECACFARVWSV